MDVESQNAALMLADSSCLLVSLTASSPCSVTPVSIPAPCTDACFLRLRTSSSSKAIHMPSVTANNPNRLALHASTHLQSSASHPGSSITGRSNAHNIQTLTHRRLAAAAETKLYMLTTQPTGDGTCMEFRAWSCDARAFSPVTVEVGSEQIVVGSTGRVAARLEAPYGLDVKIGASINVVVVYSSSAGKIWIMAAKSASGKGSSSGCSHAAAKGATALEGKGTARADDREGEGATTRLLLLNSVVLDCNRPVFSLHVSPQHLLLGENNGVRVWFLRPLIKPSKMEKDKAQVKLIKPKLKVHEEVGGFLIKRSPQNGFKWEVKLQNGGHPRVSVAEMESAVVAMTGDGRIKGSKEKDEDMQEKPSEEGGGNFLEKERINGIVQINSVGGRGNIPAPFPGDLGRDLESSVDSQGDAVSNDNFVLLHLQGTGGRNGSVPVVGAPVKHQEPVNQPTQKVSLMETASVPCPSSVPLLNGKGGTAMKRVGLAGPLFVRINEDDDIDSSVTKRRSQGAPPPTQVVDIQALNLKKFVLLDSRGTLNLLTLHESPEGQEPGTLNRFQLFTKHLQTSICVSSMAVLPLLPASVSNGAPLAGRKLWISDGKYSVHVVILSDDGTLAANGCTLVPSLVAEYTWLLGISRIVTVSCFHVFIISSFAKRFYQISIGLL